MGRILVHEFHGRHGTPPRNCAKMGCLAHASFAHTHACRYARYSTWTPMIRVLACASSLAPCVFRVIAVGVPASAGLAPPKGGTPTTIASVLLFAHTFECSPANRHWLGTDTSVKCRHDWIVLSFDHGGRTCDVSAPSPRRFSSWPVCSWAAPTKPRKTTTSKSPLTNRK